jgi:hypothetical protein
VVQDTTKNGDTTMNTTSRDRSRITLANTGGDRRIGRTRSGETLYVSIEFYKQEAPEQSPFQTTDHREIVEFNEVSIVGCTTKNGWYQSFGQIVGVLDELLPGEFEHTEELRQVWRDCHLNGIHAACIHQDHNAHVAAPNKWRKWDEVEAEQNPKCPEGYRYGSRWLVKELTEKEQLAIVRLIELLRERPPVPATTRG